jgi:hypothetical protein
MERANAGRAVPLLDLRGGWHRAAWLSLLVYELHFRQVLGAKALGKIMDRWIAANHSGAWQMGVALRRPLVLGV